MSASCKALRAKQGIIMRMQDVRLLLYSAAGPQPECLMSF